MRIAIDGRALTGRFTGDRTYWRNLLRALPESGEDWEFLVYSRTPISPDELLDTPQIRPRVVSAANDRLWTLFALPMALRRDAADLVHVQYTTPPRGICPCPVVTTVHDISFKLYPQWFPRKDQLLLNFTIPLSMRRAARVITDSESSRQDMLRVYNLPAEKIVAIPLGLPAGFGAAGSERDAEVLRTYGIEPPFVLAVGVLQPRKNLKMLAEAFGRAKKERGLPHTLVLAGKAGWGTEQDALKLAAAKGGGDEAARALHFPGYVEDADLPSLYRACSVFAYPSLYEGFGLPPLEAMACSAPVLVSDAPALPEVAGNAALIVPAADIVAWAEALGTVLMSTDVRTRLAVAGLARAAAFSWQTTAARTREVYCKVLTTA
jgi:glycosyltransferase involved in cell wall biosynthesis